MKIAIIGSREGFTKEEVKQIIYKEFNKEDRLITGGAKGVDTFAEQIIDEDDSFIMASFIIKPINPNNKLDYLFRNVEIITLADKIIAFWYKESKGTKFVIDYAKSRNKNIIIIKRD
jgi:hypothetical protein